MTSPFLVEVVMKAAVESPLVVWAKWLVEHGLTSQTEVPTQVFGKGTTRLIVHLYAPALCGVLSIGQTKPKIREFRSWNQPYPIVEQKLIDAGWQKIDGVHYGHH